MQGVFKSFVSEKELDEIKQKRQEEWEKVRRPDQPLRECNPYFLACIPSCTPSSLAEKLSII